MESSIAQIAAAQNQKARSNFEMFHASDGVLRVKEVFKLTPPILKYGRCETSVIRSRDTRTSQSVLAMHIQYKEEHRDVSEVLDEDEIISLSTALKYIAEHRTSMVAAVETYTEVTYRSRGGFQAGIYITELHEVGEFMILSGQTAFMPNLSVLDRVVDDALFRIEVLKAKHEPSAGI